MNVDGINSIISDGKKEIAEKYVPIVFYSFPGLKALLE